MAVVALASCNHRVPTAPSKASAGRTMWGFSSEVQDDDAFCVPADGGIACVTVAEVRWFVQNLRRAQ